MTPDTILARQRRRVAAQWTFLHRARLRRAVDEYLEHYHREEVGAANGKVRQRSVTAGCTSVTSATESYRFSFGTRRGRGDEFALIACAERAGGTL